MFDLVVLLILVAFGFALYKWATYKNPWVYSRRYSIFQNIE